jgi:hypothetical protein
LVADLAVGLVFEMADDWVADLADEKVDYLVF